MSVNKEMQSESVRESESESERERKTKEQQVKQDIFLQGEKATLDPTTKEEDPGTNI